MAEVKETQWGITKLIVGGFKSLSRPEPYEIAVRPLTLLAGANSSGKSSAVQPLLLLKQTLEAGFDPGPLRLHGPNARFTATNQIFPILKKGGRKKPLSIGIETEGGARLTSRFERLDDKELKLSQMVYLEDDSPPITFEASLSDKDIRSFAPKPLLQIRQNLKKELKRDADFQIVRRRCFFEIGVVFTADKQPSQMVTTPFSSPSYSFEPLIHEITHVPGLRGNPERSYRTSAVGPTFSGTFENYVASIVHQWQKQRSPQLKKLCTQLEQLRLTWKVSSKQLDAAQVELQVGRLPKAARGGARDLVNIADVGFGVSQTLPVLVALLAAEPGQLVYLEQPEIHLHPKAQVALAEILADAAGRGVRVIAETHSALLLLAIQALVAEEKLDPEDVILHWFRRDENGVTDVTTAELDRQGAYGDWPEDFGEVLMDAQGRYVSAVEEKLFRVAGA